MQFQVYHSKPHAQGSRGISNAQSAMQFPIQQDYEQQELNKRLNKPALLLFENESLLESVANSDIFQIVYNKGTRKWRWFEQRVFYSIKELFYADHHFVSQSILSKDQKIGQIRCGRTSLLAQMDKRETVTASDEHLLTWMYHLLGNYSYSVSYFKQVLDPEQPLFASKNEQALALNAVCESAAAKNQWSDCLNYATKSVALEPQQQAGYFFAWMACDQLSRHEEAFSWLDQMPPAKGTYALDVDLFVDENERLHYLIKAAEKVSNPARAFQESEQLLLWYKHNRNSDSDTLLQKLIIQSLEQDKVHQARDYMRQLLQLSLQPSLSGERWQIIDELLSLFIEKKEYNFAIQAYVDLFDNNIQRATTQRRLVGLYIKTNQIAKARALSNNSQVFFT